MPTKPTSKAKPKAKTATAKNQSLFIGFILDASGSMTSCRDATISGFNEYLNSQKREKGETIVSLTAFNQDVNIRNSLTPITEVEDLTHYTYAPSGNTALYDAIGATITAIHTTPVKDMPKRKVIVIITDGQENASREYTREQIAGMVAEREKHGWLFVYLGANQDAFAVGQSIGITKGVRVNYSSDTIGTQEVYAMASDNTSCLRSFSPHSAQLIGASLHWSSDTHLKTGLKGKKK